MSSPAAALALSNVFFARGDTAVQACLVFCRFAFCVGMADIVEQLPLEALGKILTCLGVQHFRSFKRRLTLGKRYSEDFSAFFRLMLQGENTEPKYRNLVVRYHVRRIATADHHPNCARGATCNCATLCANCAKHCTIPPEDPVTIHNHQTKHITAIHCT